MITSPFGIEVCQRHTGTSYRRYRIEISCFVFESVVSSVLIFTIFSFQSEHNPDITSKSGFTPLHIASHYGNDAIASLLIAKGADVNYAAKVSPVAFLFVITV